MSRRGPVRGGAVLARVAAVVALVVAGGCTAASQPAATQPGGSQPGGSAVPSAVYPPEGAPADAATVPPDPSNCPVTAAAMYKWGPPTRESDFQDGLPPDWHPYGPEPGHDLNGVRTPAAITVADGDVTITGTRAGTSGAMSWHPGQKYGRWEACVRSDVGKGGLNAVILLWPVAEDWPVGGEIDWMEIMDPTRQDTGFHLHYGPRDDQNAAEVIHDATTWTSWALEWTPTKITGFLNGRPWYTSTDPRTFPPRPMNMTMQLDYFGNAGAGTAMHMDWARQWALPMSVPATLGLAPGDPATGRPELFPEHTPRALPG